MNDFKFIHPDVAASYETTFTHDPKVKIPKFYNGKLSNISVAAADEAIRLGSNIITKKADASAKEPVKKASDKLGQS